MTPIVRIQRDPASLESAHDELRTTLTTLRTNAELIRLRVRGDRRATAALADHLVEIESAVARLEILAREMRAWRDELVA